MGFFKGIIDFALFKEFVTPGIIKLVYLVIFLILNVASLIGIILFGLTPVIAAVGGKGDLYTILASVLLALFVIAVGLVILVFYNLILRMYFEIALILFNIHGYLKSIDEKTGKK